MIICIVQPLIDCCEKTFESLPGLDTIVCEQLQQPNKLVTDISTRMNIINTMTKFEAAQFNTDLFMNQKYRFIANRFSVHGDQLIEAIYDVEPFVESEIDLLMNDKGKKA
jgi:hypothetical protein